jgi:hypothetical protein
MQIDSTGAKVCQTKDVTVTAPTTAFGTTQLADALQSVDVARLAVTGDTSAMVAAALQIASLLDFAATSGISTAPPASGGSDAATDAGSLAVQRTNDLIAALASSDVSDPDQLASLLSAGAKVSSKAELTTDSGFALMGLFQ